MNQSPLMVDVNNITGETIYCLFLFCFALDHAEDVSEKN